MAPTKTLAFDPAEHLANPEDQTELLNDALQSGDAGYIANALGVIARAKGMSEVARGANVTREALYKALNTKGDPKLTTFMGVLSTLKLELSVRLATGEARSGKRLRSRKRAVGSSKKATRAIRAAGAGSSRAASSATRARAG